jgi:hypothetical protein
MPKGKGVRKDFAELHNFTQQFIFYAAIPISIRQTLGIMLRVNKIYAKKGERYNLGARFSKISVFSTKCFLTRCPL